MYMKAAVSVATRCCACLIIFSVVIFFRIINTVSRLSIFLVKGMKMPIAPIYTYKTWILYVCMYVHIFLSHQKSQHHEILATGVICWANLKHDEAQFFNFLYLRILGAFFVFFYIGVFVFFFFENLRLF